MIDGSNNCIRNLKFVLYTFEWLSGLKINYHKSNAYVFGVSQEEGFDMANQLNCVLGSLRMKYLGIQVSDKHLNMGNFSFMVYKMRNRLDPWKGKNLTYGGRHILTNACLSSMPTYCMGFYLLQEGVQAKMDTIRSNFLWQGAKNSNITCLNLNLFVDLETRGAWVL